VIVKRAVVGGVAAGVVALWLAVAGQPAVAPGGVAEARVATVAWTSPMQPSGDGGGSDDTPKPPKVGSGDPSASSASSGAAKKAPSKPSPDDAAGGGGAAKEDGESLVSKIMSTVSSGVSSMFKHITGGD
jgi:hypothetical protein